VIEMKKISEEDAVKRAKKFLRDYIGDLYDYPEDDFFNDYKGEYKFENPDKPYYVWLDAEYSGCYSSESAFYSLKEVLEIIKFQLREYDKESYERWDNVIIFDIAKNKVVEPKVSL
jgi:hypothetical protein